MPSPIRVTAAALLVLLVAALPGLAAGVQVNIREWQVPWPDTRPRDPFVAPDGQVWFVGQTGDYVARLDPASGEFRRFELPQGAGPHNVIVGQNAVWYAGNRADHIGRLDPATGTVEVLTVPQEGEQDPHTLAFSTEGDIWFTSQLSNHVGRLDVATRGFSLHQPDVENARPYGLVVGPDGVPWVALFGSNHLARVDPNTGEIHEVALPREEARPRRLAVTGDGHVWYVDYVHGWLGRHDPETGRTKEWRAPAAEESGPYAMAADDLGRLWFVETGIQPNRLVGFDPETESFIAREPIPSGGKVVRHMVFDAGTRSLWFGTDANTIGRATLEDTGLAVNP